MSEIKTEAQIRFFDKNYPRRSTKKCICMNPYCQSSRIFQVQRLLIDESIWHEEHVNCKSWLFEVDNLQHWFNNKCQGNIDQTELGTDYYSHTIESIYFYKQFDSINWEDHLVYYFHQLKRMMQEQLQSIFIRTRDTIKIHLEDNHNVFQKIKYFSSQLTRHQEYIIDDLYKEYLEFDLKRMKNLGYLALSNKELLTRKAKQILDSIKEIQLCLWNKELSYDLFDRVNYQNQLNELRLNLPKFSLAEVNALLQKVQSTHKTKFEFQQIGGQVVSQCFLCNKTVYSNIEPLKHRRQQCRYKLIIHLYGFHGDIIYKKVSKARPFKLTLDLLKKEIIVKNPKKLIIIDKQNVSYLNINDYMFPPQVYCLEIVSQRTQNLAKIRFISAQSKGKDAADMMAVIVICEVSRFQLDQILVVTKDHFAATLKPMLSSLGTQIKISDNGNQLNEYKRQ